jgi:hypothetical protein
MRQGGLPMARRRGARCLISGLIYPEVLFLILLLDIFTGILRPIGKKILYA